MILFANIVFTALLIIPSINKVDTLKKHPTVSSIVVELPENKAKLLANNENTNNPNFKKTALKKVDIGIHFASGVSMLNEVSKEALTKFSDYLNKNPSTKISIIGHTDNVSILETNQKLSEIRAQSVADFLISKNVNVAQLKEIKGKNFTEPLADNATEEGRAVNRRVELMVLPPDTISNSDISSSKEDAIKTKPIPAELKKLLEEVTQQKAIKTNDVEIEVDGLLVDDTKTKSGKDFYDLFYNSWSAPSSAKNYTITISEKPFRLTSTMITVLINDNMVYQAILQPRQDIIESQTEEAVYLTQDYLANYEEIMKQLNGDDMNGSGIY
ncbi:MAG: CsgE family curli-type amyloid fiber assembly protein [Paludibacter sp.]